MKQNYLTKKQITKIKKKARKYKKLFDKITKVLNEDKEMNISKLYDFIHDEFKDYENVKGILFQFTDIKNEPPCVVITTTKNKEYCIYSNFKLIIKELDEYDDVVDEKIKQFDDIDLLRYELQGLLV